jgi:hypothetical protein
MSDRYAAEHGIPRGPSCSRSENISLRFDGDTLIMHGPRGRSYPAVSGRPSGGKFDYSSGRFGMRSDGPIPPGRYWIKPSEMWSNHWYNLASRSAWGDHRITIHVFPGTETYGRGGFFIHGGTHAGSAGCVNLHSRMEDFVRELEAATKDSQDCYVPLTVRY